MKKLLIVALAAVAPSFAFAATTGNACDNGKATKFEVTSPPATGEFVKREFTPQCSANVSVAYSQNQVAFAVASSSAKGRTYFSGSTNGGGITKDGADCPSSGCDASTLQGKADAKKTGGGSGTGTGTGTGT